MYFKVYIDTFWLASNNRIINCNKHCFKRNFKLLSAQLHYLNTACLFQKITPVHFNEFLIKFVLARGVQYNPACLIP